MGPDYDAVVVGCGPAGNTAAYRLASAGLRVAMLEREAMPRHKVCGGGLSAKTLREAPFSLAPVVERQVGTALIAYRGSNPVRCELAGIGGMTQRAVLDAYMAEQAVRAGAVLREREAFESFERKAGRIEVRTGRGTVSTRVLIGADGVYSRVRKQLLPNATPQLVPAIEALLWPRAGVMERLGDTCIFDLGMIPAGYAWVFPKRDHLNVGLYRFFKRDDNVDLRSLLQAFIASYPILRDHERVAVKALFIPVRPVARRLAVGGVLLVGDAAGLGDPFYGEGIFYAVRSGNLAARAVLGHLAANGPLRAYDRLLVGLRFQLAAARIAAQLFYRSPRLGFRFGVRNRRVSALFAGMIAGTVSPARALAGGLALAPYWLFAPPVAPIKSPIFADGGG